MSVVLRNVSWAGIMRGKGEGEGEGKEEIGMRSVLIGSVRATVSQVTRFV